MIRRSHLGIAGSQESFFLALVESSATRDLLTTRATQDFGERHGRNELPVHAPSQDGLNLDKPGD